MLENKFKTELVAEIEDMFPGCIVVHLDPNEIQGIPDLLVLYENKWAALEGKKSANAPHRPNQDYYVNLMNKESVRLGFIGAVRNLTILGTPKIGETIETTITVKEEIFQMTLVDAEIRLNGSVIVNAEMKIALSDIVA